MKAFTVEQYHTCCDVFRVEAESAKEAAAKYYNDNCGWDAIDSEIIDTIGLVVLTEDGETIYDDRPETQSLYADSSGRLHQLQLSPDMAAKVIAFIDAECTPKESQK